MAQVRLVLRVLRVLRVLQVLPVLRVLRVLRRLRAIPLVLKHGLLASIGLVEANAVAQAGARLPKDSENDGFSS